MSVGIFSFILQRNDARIIVGTFYEALARQVFCQVKESILATYVNELSLMEKFSRVFHS